MINLPFADGETRNAILGWLDRFATFVRAIDYESATPMFHPDMRAFGTYQDSLHSFEAWFQTQWKNVWPRTSDFRFNLEETQVLASADGSVAIASAPWTSTGYHRDGSTFLRPGRATMVFHLDAEKWICTHSHMSLNRGVPQDSHANRERQ
jgi:ketosteroid isomerase-like protein